jgi:hypothetical protein
MFICGVSPLLRGSGDPTCGVGGTLLGSLTGIGDRIYGWYDSISLVLSRTPSRSITEAPDRCLHEIVHVPGQGISAFRELF